MNKSETYSYMPSGRIMRILVLTLGAAIFLLLLFADKTNLTNAPEAVIGTGARASASSKLPPLAPDKKLDGWISSLDQKAGEEKLSILDSIVVTLQARNRFDYASDYADQLVALDRSLERKARAGILSQKATDLEYVSGDSSLLRRYSARAIQYLEEVTTAQPANTEALLSLGLAYVASRQQENSMKGILTIRKVLEIDPGNTEAGFQLGLFAMQTKQFDRAEERFGQVLKSDPGNEAAMLQLALAQLQLGKQEDARKLLDGLIREAKDNEIRIAARQVMQSLP